MQKKIVGALVMALMTLILVGQPALAAAPAVDNPQEEQSYGLSCSAGVCRAELDLGLGTDLLPQGAWLTVMQSALRFLPDNLGIELADDVTISLPTGDLSLADANLVLTLDEAGKIATLRGSAAAPVPTFGLLGDWQVVTPARVEVGFDRGDALTNLNAPLQADRRYFFMDAEAGLHLLSSSMALTAQPGHRATLVVDFAQPLVYVDGHVTLHTDGQMAFIREALGPLGDSAWMPSDLPINQSVLVHLQGQLGKEIEPKLTLAGEYRVDGGMVGKWMQIDATPLLAQGKAIIGPDGLMIEGNARSILNPETWFDSGAQAQLYVPFDAPESASLTVGADVASPAFGVEHGATATVAGEAGWLERTGSAAWAGVQNRWNQAGPAMQSGYEWLGAGISTGVEFTQEQWCSLTGSCAVVSADESATQVAVVEK